MSQVHIFLGPSLPTDEAHDILPGAVLHPPVRAGDVYAATRNGATIIGIVDGLFETVPAVWHKEILYALSQGVHVLGASSMGALRAAELDSFGMVGIGAIYGGFRDGIHEDDDEVAVVHGDAEQDFCVLSEAMVNLRHGLAQALAADVIGTATHDRLVAFAKATPYPHRSWAMLEEQGLLDAPEREALQAFLSSTRPDLKRDDAILLLKHIAGLSSSALAPFQAGFEFETTVFWDQLIAAVRSSPEIQSSVPSVSIEALRAHVGAIEDDAPDIFAGALLLYLCIKEAQRSGIDVDEELLLAAKAGFCLRHEIGDPATLQRWLSEQRMDEAEFEALVRVEAIVSAIAKHHSPGLDAFLPAQLKRDARYGAVATAIDQKRALLDGFGLSHPSAEDIGTTTEALLDWYEDQYRPLRPTLEMHIEARRFVERSRFVRELIGSYLAASTSTLRANDHVG